MLKPVLTLAALLGLCYMMADKAKIPEFTRQTNRVALPVLIVAGLVFGLIVATA